MHPNVDLSTSIEEGHQNPNQRPRVDFTKIRSFRSSFGSSLKETLFPDNPFKQFKSKQSACTKVFNVIKYFCPIVEWGAKYSSRFFQADLLAGLTIASLAIPQGISYAKLAKVPPIIGLYTNFVPPLIYAFFGTSRELAVGTGASSSLLAASIIGAKVSAEDDPELYLHLFFTAAFCTGVFTTALGVFRLGFLVDFLSRPILVGFMGGTAVIILLQQLKGFFGLEKFTPSTDVVSVLHIVFVQTHAWRWPCIVMGIAFVAFLLGSQYVKKKIPKLFWLSAACPMAVVIIGGLLAYIFHLKEHGIQIVGPLHKGLNPLSIQKLNFQPRYFGAVLQTGLLTAIITMAEGMAVGRVFSVVKNYQIDGNKEMVAFGLMNIAGSFSSCYVTTGIFSKSAVNYNAGSMTPASNLVMAIMMMLVLLFLAPLFSYTPLVCLSAVITAAMLPLIKYKQIYRFYVVDKGDFLICMAAFISVA